MTLQDLGSLGEFVAALATVGTLAYLALQVRQNSHQLADATRTARMTAIDRSVEAFARYRSMLSNADNAALYTRGLASYRGLSQEDSYRFRAIIEEYFFSFSALFERVKQEFYDRETWARQAAAAATVIDTPGGAEWWAERRMIFSDAFVAEIESARSDAPDR